MVDNAKKLSPLDYQMYKLHTNLKDEKSVVYSLVVKYYKDIQDGDAVYLLVKSLLRGDALQVFKNKEASQDVKDRLVFTKCLAAVTEHFFPTKLNNYLECFPIPDKVTAKKITREEFIDILEDRVPYQ
eukprot:11885034-Ditylum_brightwellii.AAC.1